MADLVVRSFEDISYRRLHEQGFRPGAIIDVGAHEGNWTRLTQSLFGPVPALMVEARAAMVPSLDQVRADLPHVDYAIALLDETADEARTFFAMGTGSSFLPEASNAPREASTLTTRTLDAVAAEKLPDSRDLFLKIDVQGAELHVLRGGTATLARAALVQLEVALLPYNAGAPLMPEVIAFMAARGLLPTEVSGFSRPEGHLVQIDLLFAPENSPLRPKNFVF